MPQITTENASGYDTDYLDEIFGRSDSGSSSSQEDDEDETDEDDDD